jgi:octaprenyl-diphosphate synthase
MVHMATLVHDDVLDGADERRRQPTVGAIAGNEAAVLLGDFLISHAYHLCSSLDSQFAARRVAQATNTVCEGELLQNHFSGDFEPDESRYYEIVRRKTGALTAVACELGAAFAGAHDDVTDGLRRYGMHAGVAFQIIDDVLDFVGDEAEVGKTLGRDCALGKPTLPVMHCLRESQPGAARALRRLLADPARTNRQQVLEQLQATGSIDFAVSVARAQTAEALACLDHLPETEARRSLEAMAAFIIRRRF